MFPLILNTGRVRDQWHTMTRTGRVAYLMTHVAAPRLDLLTRDAALRGIADRGLVRMESTQGSIVMRASLDDGVRPGDVFAAMPVSPISRARQCASPQSPKPGAAICFGWRIVWWAKAQIGAGFAFELSGFSALAEEVHCEAVLRQLLQIPAEAELVSYSDSRKATFRYAGIVDGRPAGCAFFGPPESDYPGLDQATNQLGKEISALERIALLAGFEATTSTKRGKTVCSCFSVSEENICAALRDEGLKTVAQIGVTLKVGTNCGSCIPELKKLLSVKTLTGVA